MIGRVIEIQEDGRYLHLYRGFMVVSAEDKEIARIPLDEIAVVMANSYQLTYSNALLIELTARGIAFITCGNNHNPQAILWPVTQHFHQGMVMKAQANASESLKKQLWKEIIQCKIRFQYSILEKANIKGAPLLEISKRVKSGDSENLEAQAARWYWPLLFGKSFVRNSRQKDINPLLNYGYAIIRGGMARAVMAAGLHPTFGIFHKNLLNPMCLVDDIMEPYRPIIDWHIFQFTKKGIKTLTPEIKKELAALLSHDCTFKDKSTPLSMAMLYTAQSLSLCLQEGNYRKLQLPDRLFNA
jgi:CRISPR-associated protein Cas1